MIQPLTQKPMTTHTHNLESPSA